MLLQQPSAHSRISTVYLRKERYVTYMCNTRNNSSQLNTPWTRRAELTSHHYNQAATEGCIFLQVTSLRLRQSQRCDLTIVNI